MNSYTLSESSVTLCRNEVLSKFYLTLDFNKISSMLDLIREQSPVQIFHDLGL